jgi:hypothetical protein
VRHLINSTCFLTVVCFLPPRISILITVLTRKLQVETKEGQESKIILFACFAPALALYSFLYRPPILRPFLAGQNISFSKLTPLFQAF